ncbi:MAG: peptidylprolyl isomerase [Ignavibacteria bacterium]|nr:peptidylprolyl isomerase [Ignavibacteria bacterium]
MNIYKLLSLVILAVVMASCGKQYSSVNVENEIKNGKKIEEVIKLKDREQLVATINTNHGTIEFELYPNEAPKAVTNFIGLSLQGFYNKLTFHRVLKNFMIQTGDPTATGSGGKSYFGSEFEDECPLELKHNSPGTVSMANRGPHTNTSQFFITTVATPWLDGKHTLFGKVIDGMDVVYEIGAVETDRMEKPVKPIIINSISIEKRIH